MENHICRIRPDPIRSRRDETRETRNKKKGAGNWELGKFVSIKINEKKKKKKEIREDKEEGERERRLTVTGKGRKVELCR